MSRFRTQRSILPADDTSRSQHPRPRSVVILLNRELTARHCTIVEPRRARLLDKEHYLQSTSSLHSLASDRDMTLSMYVD